MKRPRQLAVMYYMRKNNPSVYSPVTHIDFLLYEKSVPFAAEMFMHLLLSLLIQMYDFDAVTLLNISKGLISHCTLTVISPNFSCRVL